MTIIAYGINHSTAPVDIREKVSFGTEIMPNALNELKNQNGVYEAAILSLSLIHISEPTRPY